MNTKNENGDGTGDELFLEAFTTDWTIQKLFRATNSGKKDAANSLFNWLADELESGEELNISTRRLIAMLLRRIARKNLALRVTPVGSRYQRKSRTLEQSERVYFAVVDAHSQGLAISADKAFAEVSEQLNMSISSVSRHYYEFKKIHEESLDKMMADMGIENILLEVVIKGFSRNPNHQLLTKAELEKLAREELRDIFFTVANRWLKEYSTSPPKLTITKPP
ncbi:hypothetical protein ACFL1J_06740 [Pseudomonadota bacterium]